MADQLLIDRDDSILIVIGAQPAFLDKLPARARRPQGAGGRLIGAPRPPMQARDRTDAVRSRLLSDGQAVANP